MAQHEIETQWMGKMQFNSLINGHTIMMDAPERSGGDATAPIPKPLVLAALSGCTGMDIIALLRKENITPHDFEMKVTGTLSKQAPIQYEAIHLIYNFKDAALQAAPLIKAVNDSQEKYCGVSSMLKKALPLTWEIVFNNEVVFNNAPELTAMAG